MKPIFYLDFDFDDFASGIDAIALVDYPAVERNFLCFKNERAKFAFDDAKHLISGVVALADVPIYRYDDKKGEYFIVFKKEVVRKMMEQFFKKGLISSVNLQHDEREKIEDVYLVESYLKDSERGIVPIEFADVPDGSWIATYKVDNLELWSQITKGDDLNGFSLQGFFDTYLQQKKDDINEFINNLI